MEEKYFEIWVKNSPTILSKIIKIIIRRRINIQVLLANVDSIDPGLAEIKIVLEADDEKFRLVLTHIGKLADVLDIKSENADE